ncbi:MAG: HupE/UreJ family protein [Thiohalobacterales bacterium]|nr:HupE/UreJ family protein [Thiohalobacterales bacterium]
MQGKKFASVILGITALLTAPVVAAHEGFHLASGLVDGFMHPASGIDHLLIAIAAGYWAARAGDHGLQDMLAFLALFAGGLLLGAASLAWVQPELVTPVLFVLTVAVIAVAIAMPQWFYQALFGGLALYQGMVHMLAAPPAGGISGFAIGLFISTAVLLKLGLMLRIVISTFRSHRSG